VALRGTFEETEPPDLLQILALGGKSGVLTVFHQGRTARLAFRGGDVVHAVDGARQGEEVVLSLLSQRAGSFVFTTEDVPEERTIDRSVPALLLSAAQRVDDLTRANGLLKRPSARVSVPETVTPERLSELAEGERELLGLIDGRRSVGEIVVATEAGVSRAYALLASLIERELVEVVPAAEEDSPLLAGDPDDERLAAAVAAVGARRPTAVELTEVAQYLRQAVGNPGAGGG